MNAKIYHKSYIITKGLRSYFDKLFTEAWNKNKQGEFKN